MSIVDTIGRMLRPVSNRVSNLVSRGVLKLVDDAKKFQALQVELLDGEIRDDVERVQNYGFTSVPVEGAEVVAVCVGGKRDHAVVIAVDDRQYRLRNLESGEVAVYDKTGSKFLLKANGNIEITPSSGTLALVGDMTVSGSIQVEGDAAIGGNADVTGDVTAAEVTGGGKVLSTHVHSVSGIATAGTAAAQNQTVPVDTAAPS